MIAKKNKQKSAIIIAGNQPTPSPGQPRCVSYSKAKKVKKAGKIVRE